MSQDAGYPAGANLAAHWKPTGTRGTVPLAVPDGGEPLTLEWWGLRLDDGSYLASYFGEQFLGIFRRAGCAWHADEHYRYTSVTNSGRTVREFTHAGTTGVCCSELVIVARTRPLSLEPAPLADAPARHVVEVGHQRDHSFHEVEVEDFRCTATFDLARHTVHLARTRFRDAST